MFSACHRFSWLNCQPDFLPYRLDGTGYFPRPVRRSAHCNLWPGASRAKSGGVLSPHLWAIDKERANLRNLQITVRGFAAEKQKSSELSFAAPWLVPFPEVLRLQIQALPLLVERIKSQDPSFSVGTHPGWVDPHDRILLGTEGSDAGLVQNHRLGQNRVSNNNS